MEFAHCRQYICGAITILRAGTLDRLAFHFVVFKDIREIFLCCTLVYNLFKLINAFQKKIMHNNLKVNICHCEFVDVWKGTSPWKMNPQCLGYQRKLFNKIKSLLLQWQINGSEQWRLMINQVVLGHLRHVAGYCLRSCLLHSKH